MALELTVGSVLNMVGGLVVVGFGAFVAIVARWAPASRAFVIFSSGFGLAVTVRNIADSAVATPSLALTAYTVAGIFWLVAAVGLVWFGLTVPAPAQRGDRGLLVLPAVILAGHVVFAFWEFTSPARSALADDNFSDAGLFIHGIGSMTGLGAYAGLLLVLALRMAHLAADEQRHAVLLSAALLPYFAYTAGLLAFDAVPYTRNAGLVLAVPVMVIAVLWLRVTSMAPLSRAARNMAILGPAMMLYGAVEVAYFGISVNDNIGGASGVLRVFAVVVLGYTVVRHHLLGIDVKLRFTISKGTVAAVIVAVIFVASEGAQTLFGQEKQWLGLVAGAVVIFAIAPLQRAADRLAQKVVPPTTFAADARVTDADEMYRSAVRLALLDRRLTRSEEGELFRLARGLGLEADRAHELLSEVESSLE